MNVKHVWGWIAGTSYALATTLTGDNFTIDWLSGWHSQYGQDRKIMRWLYSEHASNEWYSHLAGENRRQGVFIELGAGDGVDKSNTLAFEQKLGWTGLLIEPSTSLYQQLRQNRPNAKCVNTCVAAGAIQKDFVDSGLNSGTSSKHRLMTSAKGRSLMMCESLSKLIDIHLGHLGSKIDYLSLDVEGSELEILRHFDFQKHQVDVMSIEVDNALPQVMYRRLSNLLRRNGFRFMERISVDEVWVRQRGFHPDPSCSLPVQLQTLPKSPRKGWGGVRTALEDLLQVLKQAGPDESVSISALDLGPDVEILFHYWSNGDLRDWDDQCPVGMLTLGLAFSLLRDRTNNPQTDTRHMFIELGQQTVFFWTERLAVPGR